MYLGIDGRHLVEEAALPKSLLEAPYIGNWCVCVVCPGAIDHLGNCKVFNTKVLD
jgi:hypothetical protein